MKVSLYARVSMDESSDEKRLQNPDNQLLPLREYCKSMGWEIVKEYVDYASGSNPNREQFRQMFKDAHQRKFDLILVWKLDRFSREGITHTLAYIKDLKRFGVGLKSLTESWIDTTDNSLSELLLAIFSWVAEEERRKISERTKLGIQRRRNLGIWKGGRPKGSKDKNPRKKGSHLTESIKTDSQKTSVFSNNKDDLIIQKEVK